MGHWTLRAARSPRTIQLSFGQSIPMRGSEVDIATVLLMLSGIL